MYRYRGAGYYGLLKHQGKQIRQSLETSDREMAERKLRALRKKLETTDPSLARRTMAEHRERFNELITGSKSTQESEKHHARRLVEEWPKSAPTIVGKVRKGHVLEWLKPLRDTLSPASVNKHIATARKFFNLAVDDGVIDRSPVEGIKYGKPAKIVRNTPTEDQFRAIVAELRKQTANGHGAQDSADFVELAGTLGIGQAELSGIRRQDIDLDAGVIRLFRRKTSSAFTIPIFPDARPIIERRMADMPEEPEARLLPHDNCKKGLEGACRRLGFPHFEPRSMRRFHITRALRAGIDAPTVASWQGHRDGGALVLKTYQAEMGMAHSLRMAAMLGPKPENVVEMKQEVAS